jgi:hypothetical protein
MPFPQYVASFSKRTFVSGSVRGRILYVCVYAVWWVQNMECDRKKVKLGARPGNFFWTSNRKFCHGPPPSLQAPPKINFGLATSTYHHHDHELFI